MHLHHLVPIGSAQLRLSSHLPQSILGHLRSVLGKQRR
ncbi:Uncharacterised protein [Vibrio cholerae]|nr:Uncharacterised protein [Vibrio cholerae]